MIESLSHRPTKTSVVPSVALVNLLDFEKA